MEPQYGWKCPQCSAIYGPTVERCAGCSTPKSVTGGTFTGYTHVGTISVSSTWDSSILAGCGTVYFSSAKTEAVRAREVVDDWRVKGFSPKSLIIAATDSIIEDSSNDDYDEDEDD